MTVVLSCPAWAGPRIGRSISGSCVPHAGGAQGDLGGVIVYEESQLNPGPYEFSCRRTRSAVVRPMQNRNAAMALMRPMSVMSLVRCRTRVCGRTASVMIT